MTKGMPKIEVVKVDSKERTDDFVALPYDIYRGCEQYVPDLDSEVKDFINPEVNPSFEFADIQPFVAYKGKKAVGRIVGIVNHKANERWHCKKVRFTMIEFIDDPKVAEALIGAVEEWGKERGMTEIEGPMGVTDFDKEGMQVEDFDQIGTVHTFYNHAYYPQRLEAMGFQKEADWVQIRIRLPKQIPARFTRTAQYVREQVGLRVVHMKKSDLRKRGYGRKVFDLLNQAYAPLFGFSKFSDKQIDAFIEKYVPLLDMKMFPIVLNDKDEVVGAAITMVNLSRAMQKTKGHLWPLGWWHLRNALKRKRSNTVDMMLIAVRPDYQGMGVNALFFDDLITVYNQYGFEFAETLPQLETNVRELSQWKLFNPEYIRRRRCYIKTI